ncbi:hypothetical protein FACUT_6328 [Fusarium acutatum]|uniref:RRM domain-containing protein n=1 Tax=Fusarium acutatum TaxID=78861 RepID=A0A8H4JTU9_9HYPO|nr:hypothetical protein FACUT_6328 [Fusarium acutatum]
MEQIPNSSFEEGGVVFLGGIPLNAEKQETAAFVHYQGFGSTGYCIVEFSMRSEAKEAIKRLTDDAFKGKYVQTAIPERRKQPSSQSIASNLRVKAEAIPMEAGAINTATEPSFESRRVEPLLSTHPAVQSSPVENVSSGHKADLKTIRKDLQELKYPEAYACSEHWPKSDVESAVIGRMLEREKEEGSPGSLVVKDNGRFRIRSRVFPSPFGDDAKNCSTIWINVTKLESDGRKIKIIALSELPLYQENGWHEWFKGKVSIEEGTGSDQRNVSIVGDVNAPEDHTEDTL